MIIDAVLQNKNTKKQIYKYAVCSLSGTYCLNDPTLSGEISRISCGSRWPFCKLEPTQLSTQLSCLLSNEMYITSQPLISSACLACRIFWFPPAECCSGGCRRPNFRRAAVFQKPLAVHNYPGQQKVSETRENGHGWRNCCLKRKKYEKIIQHPQRESRWKISPLF